MAMTDDESKALRTVRAVIAVADANFPRDCEIVISAPGKQTASITLPTYLLRGLLKDEH